MNRSFTIEFWGIAPDDWCHNEVGAFEYQIKSAEIVGDPGNEQIRLDISRSPRGDVA